MENENKWEYDYSEQNRGSGQPDASAAGAGVNTAGAQTAETGSAQSAAAAAPAQSAAQAQPAQAPAQEAAAASAYVNVGSSGTNAANQYEGAPASGGSFAGNPGGTAPAGGYAGAQAGAYTAQGPAGYGAPGPMPGAPGGMPNYGGYGYAGGGMPPRYPNGPAPQYTAPQPRKKPHRAAGSHSVAARIGALALALGVGFGGGMLGSYIMVGSAGNKVVVQSVERDTSAASATSTSTDGHDLSLTEVSALVSPSVVVITTEQMVSSGGWYGQNYVESGAGSGVIMSADGYILTCAHVVSGASQITVTIDGTDYAATVVGEDSESDIAVLKIDATGLTPAVMGDSDGLAVGEQVVAVGNPLGELGGTVTDGIISALDRDVVVEDQEMSLIQMSASVSPGNSGGGLFNMAGELVGIVNAKSSDTDAEGLGFAIPINTAYSVAKELIEQGYVSGRPAMGITVIDINDETTASYYGVTAYGVYVYAVEDGSPAAAAGLKTGDRIISIGDTAVSSRTDVSDYIANCKVGDTVTMTIARDGKTTTVNVTLADKNSITTSESDSASSESSSEAVTPGSGQGTAPDGQSSATANNGQAGGGFSGGANG
jgi:serine protease Do